MLVLARYLIAGPSHLHLSLFSHLQQLWTAWKHSDHILAHSEHLCGAIQSCAGLVGHHAVLMDEVDRIPVAVGLVGPGLIGKTLLSQLAEQVGFPFWPYGLACEPSMRLFLAVR